MSIDYAIAQKLFAAGKALEGKHNTLFTAIDEYGIDSDLSKTAINGVANIAKLNINLYRNVILPAAKDLEAAVKSKANVVTESVSDKVTIRTLHYQDGLDILDQLSAVDVKVVSDYTRLPTNPLVITYTRETVSNNIQDQNASIYKHIEEILLEYEDGYLEKLHDKIFSSVSSNNVFIRDMGLQPTTSYNDAMLGLALTLGYINGTIPVSNIPTKTAVIDYLYTLRNIFVTTLAKYRMTYNRLIEYDTLIVRVAVDERKDTREVYVVGEVYSKYLENNSVDAIIGMAIAEPDSVRVTLTQFVESVDRHLESYSSFVRTATIKSDLNKINVLRLAYKMASKEFLDGLTPTELKDIDIYEGSVHEANEEVVEYVNDLIAVDLLDVTKVTRYIVSVITYGRPGFLEFTYYMSYYHELFPKLDVDGVATSAMVAMMIDTLDPQIIVRKPGGA